MLTTYVTDKIIQEVGGDKGVQGILGILSLREVSRAWRAACTDYSGTAQISVERNTDLAALCRVMPSLSGLNVSCKRMGYLKLDPLAKLQQLTSLVLTGEPYHAENRLSVESAMELDVLPASLRELQITSLFAEPDGMRNVRFRGLTKLSYHWQQNGPWDLPILLGTLTRLKELSCGPLDAEGQQPHDTLVDVITILPHLTKLKLQQGYVDHEGAWSDESPVQELLLESDSVNLKWLARVLGQQFTSLHFLEIVFSDLGMSYDESSSTYPKPITTLRTLRIDDSEPRFLGLAPASLESLSYKPGTDRNYKSLQAESIATLTALTHLELEDVPDDARLSWLRSPRLEELMITNCPHAASVLLAPAGLQSLKKLHLEEFEEGTDIFAPSQTPTGKEPLICSSLLDLPHLKQITGAGTSLEVMARKLQSWQEIPCSDLSVSTFRESSSEMPIRMWRK